MNVSTDTLLESLRALAGEHAREAHDADAVAGVQPQMVAEPETAEQVAAALAFANERGLKVLPCGGGSQQGMGAPPSAGDIVLSTRRMNRVIEHAPHDLTVSVEAGLRLTDLQATLAATSQWLALDPALAPEATVGGLIATNVSGPRRLRYGGVRDQIIGVRVALADGTLAKGGGKVVKNVAGYDLPKLFTGSLGTLGVIVSATFRLYPILPFSRTVVVTAGEPAQLCQLALRVTGSTLVPTALDLRGDSPDGPCTLAVRFESGVEAAVDDQSHRVVEMAAGRGSPGMLTGEEERTFWTGGFPARGAADGASRILTRTSVLPASVAGWLERLRGVSGARGIAAAYRAHVGHGLIETRMAGDEVVLAEAVGELRASALEGRGSLVLTDAPSTFAARVDPWGPVAALAVMRRLKDRFDPNGTINPGRFVGGL
jgi:glycolate oxidase FAD binding subunit